MIEKFSNFLAKLLFDSGIRLCATVTGGSVVHLIDSAKGNGINVVYAHHEQGAAYIAEGYERVSKNRAVCMVTTGPAGTNAITGLASCWTDSIPLVFVSGQVRTPFLTRPGSVRQIGSQHLDIVSVVSSLTKGATVLDGTSAVISRKVNSLLALRDKGRPGPIWIDIPLDLQEKLDDWEAANYESSLAEQFESSKFGFDENIVHLVKNIITKIELSRRPLFLIGYGCHLSGATDVLLLLAKNFGIPVVFTWNTLDSLPTEHELNMGLVGVNGTREGNLAVYKADLILAFGSHLSRQITSNTQDDFGPNAEILVFDIDKTELANLPERFTGVEIDLKLMAKVLDVEFPNKISCELGYKRFQEWRNLCKTLKGIRDFGKPSSDDLSNDKVCQYYFYTIFNSKTRPGDVIVIDGGGNTLFSTHQNIEIKAFMRLITGHGMAAMGSGIPHSIGAAFALIEFGSQLSSRVYCFIGDGSMQFNIQELAVLKYHNLPVTIIIINNDGYLAIKNTQDNFFAKRFGVDFSSGLEIPSFKPIVEGYGLNYLSIHRNEDVNTVLECMDAPKGPLVIEVFVHEDTPLIPRLDYYRSESGVTSRDPIYDMSPKIPREIIQNLDDV
jgi:acetolactate synthase-1/2/3 large subunit